MMPIWIPITTAVISLAALTLAIVNWIRLRPALFIVGPHDSKMARTGGLVLFESTFEIHNAGASGVTISALGVTPKGMGLIRQRTSAYETEEWLSRKSPLRIDPYGTEFTTVNWDVYDAHNFIDGDPVYLFSIEWYGRKKLWPYRVVKPKGKVWRLRKLSKVERRRRSKHVELAHRPSQ